MSSRKGFLMFVLALATVMSVATGIGSGLREGVTAFLIVFGFWAVISVTRSERFAQLRPEPHDERQQHIATEAAAFTSYVLIGVALVGAFFENLDGRYGPYGVMCSIGGAAFLLASLVLPRRR